MCLRHVHTIPHGHDGHMELYDAMRTTGAVRQFTGDPLPDDVLERILEHARFAPSGGNRQGVRVIAVREAAIREALVQLALPGARRYLAQRRIGEAPWNALRPCGVDAATVEATEVPAGVVNALTEAEVVLVMCLDL